MAHWYNEFNSVFWTGIATALLGSFAMAVKYALRSKCDDLNLCWGFIKIHRRVELEVEIPSSDDESKSSPATPKLNKI